MLFKSLQKKPLLAIIANSCEQSSERIHSSCAYENFSGEA
jgi:hypothetical protein